MATISLHTGDKVHLPSFIEIYGKTHKLISYDSHKSKQLKGIFCICSDLSKIKNSIENYLQNPSHDFEHFHALVIVYRKCWNQTGARCFKLEIERDLKNTPKDLLDFHNFLFNIGNKYTAHSDQTNYDQSSMLLIMDDQKAIGALPCKMALENLDPDNYRIWLRLIISLETNLNPLFKKMEKSVIDEYNSSLKIR